MDKRRVYQVAKDKKLSSDALISMLRTMGHEVKSHMSVVTEDMLGAITSKIDEEKKSSIEEVQRQREKEESRKKEAAKARRERETPSPSGTGGSGGGAAPRSKSIERIAADGAARGGVTDGRRRRRGKRDEAAGSVAREGGTGGGGQGTGGGGRGGGRRSGGGPLPPGVGGRGRGGPRRRQKVDAQSVQDTVRKTLSQIAEGRTRRRYDRGSKAEGEEGAQ